MFRAFSLKLSGLALLAQILGIPAYAMTLSCQLKPKQKSAPQELVIEFDETSSSGPVLLRLLPAQTGANNGPDSTTDIAHATLVGMHIAYRGERDTELGRQGVLNSGIREGWTLIDTRDQGHLVLNIKRSKRGQGASVYTALLIANPSHLGSGFASLNTYGEESDMICGRRDEGTDSERSSARSKRPLKK